MPKTVRTLLIVGGGTAGWMTAAALSLKLSRLPIRILLVESAEIGTVGVGEATVPHIRFFNEALGIDEADFIRRTKATFKLGIEFRNWGRIGDSYIHPFGDFGRPLDGLPFVQQWLQGQVEGDAHPLEHFSVAALAARTNRFQPFEGPPTDPLSTFAYAYQFDASLYGAFMRSLAESRGVQRIEERIEEVELAGSTGAIEAVVLASGQRIEADLFIDCSGFRGLLIERALKAGYDDWQQWLPCDRAIAMPCALEGPLTPYTRATAQSAGWTWRIPLQHRVGNGHVYSSSFLSDDEAERMLREELEGEPAAAPNRLRFLPGKRKRQWVGNCVSIGLAAGFIEPLESTSIHLIQVAIATLLDNFPAEGCEPSRADQFNRTMDMEYERIRDFIVLHYCATQRTDSDFWNYLRTMPLPDTLHQRLEAFRRDGTLFSQRGGMFHEASWIAVLLGQNILPGSYRPEVARLTSEQRSAALAAMADEVAALVAATPAHGTYLEQQLTAVRLQKSA